MTQQWNSVERTALKTQVDDLLDKVRQQEQALVEEAKKTLAGLVELARLHVEQQNAGREKPRG